MLNDIKLALRISHNALDSEITELIEEARQDLQLSGISSLKANDDLDSLIKRVIKTYAKAQYAKDNKDAERYQKAYDLLKNHLTLSADYRAGDSVE